MRPRVPSEARMASESNTLPVVSWGSISYIRQVHFRDWRGPFLNFLHAREALQGPVWLANVDSSTEQSYFYPKTGFHSWNTSKIMRSSLESVLIDVSFYHLPKRGSFVCCEFYLLNLLSDSASLLCSVKIKRVVQNTSESLHFIYLSVKCCLEISHLKKIIGE